MNRRGFLEGILKTGISAMILPSAVTYAGRAWKKPADSFLLVCENSPLWENAEYEIDFLFNLPYQSTLDNLVKEQIIWPKNMGSTLRAVRLNN